MKESPASLLLTAASLMAGVVTIGIVGSVGQFLHRPPVGLDIRDREAFQRFFVGLPLTAFLMVLLSWLLGSTVAACLAARMTGAARYGVLASLLILLLGLNMLLSLSYPGWCWLAGPMMFILGGAVGIRLARVPRIPTSGS